jgi:hypothetical protein
LSLGIDVEERTFPTGFPRGERAVGAAEKRFLESLLRERLRLVKNRMKIDD